MTRRLRVMQVIDSLHLGGAEQLLVTLARYIDRTRFDLHVCSLAPLVASSVVRDLRALDVPIYGLPGTRRRDPRHPFQLAGLVRRHGVDVLHSHLTYGNTVGPLAGALARRPVVSTLHNVREAYPGLTGVKQWVQTQSMRLFADTVIACAPEVRAAALERLRLPDARVIAVANGIDTTASERLDPRAVAARRRELLGTHGGPLIVTVGNLRAAKGHECLVDAARLIAGKAPDVRVVIVGRGGDYEAVIRERIVAYGLGDRVLLAGERRDVAALLAAADLFVLPSLLEGLPLALLEAMAAGTPVVATAVGGVPRLVEDGVTGRLVPPADTEALASAIVDLLRRPEEARRLADAGRVRVHAAYGAHTWTRRLQDIYSAVALNQNGKGSMGGRDIAT